MNKRIAALPGLVLSGLVLSGVGSLALAGGGMPQPTGHSAVPVPVPVTNSYTYACENGQRVQVRYIVSDPDLKRDPVFVVLGYGGNNYGLAEAVSASGSRYVGLSGLNTASGLEWWEHHDEGTLSRYNPANGQTTPLLTGCRIQN